MFRIQFRLNSNILEFSVDWTYTFRVQLKFEIVVIIQFRVSVISIQTMRYIIVSKEESKEYPSYLSAAAVCALHEREAYRTVSPEESGEEDFVFVDFAIQEVVEMKTRETRRGEQHIQTPIDHPLFAPQNEPSCQGQPEPLRLHPDALATSDDYADFYNVLGL